MVVRWTSLYDLAHAYAWVTCDAGKVARFEAEFPIALRQTSYEAACWISLYTIKERKAGDHLKRLLMACPVRIHKGVVELDMHGTALKPGAEFPSDVPCLAGGLKCVCGPITAGQPKK
jgi:hypothetical protein